MILEHLLDRTCSRRKYSTQTCTHGCMHVQCKQHMQGSPLNEAEPHLIIFQTFMPIILMNKLMLCVKSWGESFTI